MHQPTLCAVAVAVLAALPGAQAAIYTKKSPVLQVEAKDYDRLIAKSNQTSIVEFYAPWCGHCQNLKPAYEKAAKNLEGLAKVAAVNCDDDANKPFCGTMGVQGFPTLKIIRPNPKKPGKPAVEDYQGQRTATAIVEAVVERINNHVKRLTDKDIDSWLEAGKEKPKALLFSDKGTTTALLKSLAIDFLDVVSVGQVRNTQAKAVEKFGVTKFPTLVLLPGGDAEPVVYDGELKKEAMTQFISQAGAPNPDPAPSKADKKEKKEKKEKKTSSSSKTKTTASEAPTETIKIEEVDIEEDPTVQKPVIIQSAIPIPAINTPEKLITECLTEKSTTCVLALVPSTHGEAAKTALTSLSELAFKHSQGKRHLFPFFEVAKENGVATRLLKELDLNGEVELIAVNARRGWWRQYEGADFSQENVERWIDAIRLSEGTKKKLPEGLVAISIANESSSGATPEATPVTAKASEKDSATSEEPTGFSGADPVPEPETAAPHDEL